MLNLKQWNEKDTLEVFMRENILCAEQLLSALDGGDVRASLFTVSQLQEE